VQLSKILAITLLGVFFIFLGKLILDDKTPSSNITGKPFPQFQQLTLDGNSISHEYFIGKKVIVNVWASWCITCLVEHPFLSERASEISIIGINYKDHKSDAVNWLNKNGNFFSTNIHDPIGNLAIDLGVTGAPESFLVIDGKIVSHVLGELNQKKWEENFAPYL
jgi:cytochrome c biogenesis protein CcmG/thiol:disulfide interchange protein DsbE